MFVCQEIDRSSPRAFYEALAEQTRHLIAGEKNLVANLSNVSALLGVYLEDVNWVGFYLWSPAEQELVVGPFQGKPACVRIPLGKGVCGTAAKNREPLVVPDVFAFPGHIACDPASRSELVIPMLKDDELLGVLDIDSPVPNRFSQEDVQGLQAVLEVLVAGTDWLNGREVVA